MISKQQINNAVKGTMWDTGNDVLYNLCKERPDHKKEADIIAKTRLIGRSYAAAIERREITNNNDVKGDDFYLKVVAPKILKEHIDVWLSSLKQYKKIDSDNLEEVLRIHKKLTDLFSEISGLNKTSLASKYLHFHYPDLFFIYDSRVVSALSTLSDITGRSGKCLYKADTVDNKYRLVCEKCLKIRDYIEKNHVVFRFSQ